MFFHADPHPANLIVMPNNEVCFIDFGAVGRFSTHTRKTLREFQHHMICGDIGRMVNCGLSLIGPLPPMDVERIRIEMDKVYAEGVYAMASRDAEWWEHGGAQSWLRFLNISGESLCAGKSSQPPKLFRTTFAYDAVVVRLNKDLNLPTVWGAYAREAAAEARTRVKKKMRERLRGPTDMDYMAMEEFGDMVTQFSFQLQRGIENPIIHFRNIVGKIAYIASLFLKLGYLIVSAIGLALITDAVARRWFDYHIDWASVLDGPPL